jgi:hypothetical protein
MSYPSSRPLIDSRSRSSSQVPNVTPHELVADVIQMNRTLDHWAHDVGDTSTRMPRRVVEEINDHSVRTRSLNPPIPEH